MSLPEEKYLSLKEAGKMLGYSPSYLSFLIRSDKIKAKKVAATVSWRVSAKDLLAYCRKNKNLEGRAEEFSSLDGFLSLKDAAKVSGYSADYIGSLLRSKKLNGKKEYAGISWFVDQKSLIDYKQQKEEKPIELKKTVFIVQRRPVFNFRFVRQYSFLALLASLVLGGGLLAWALTSQTEPQTVNIYSLELSGNWEKSENAKGVPESGPDSSVDSFSEINSSVYRSGPQELVFSGFNLTETDLVIENSSKDEPVSEAETMSPETETVSEEIDGPETEESVSETIPSEESQESVPDVEAEDQVPDEGFTEELVPEEISGDQVDEPIPEETPLPEGLPGESLSEQQPIVPEEVAPLPEPPLIEEAAGEVLSFLNNLRKIPQKLFSGIQKFAFEKVVRAEEAPTFEGLQETEFISAKVKLSLAISERKDDLLIVPDVPIEEETEEILPEEPIILNKLRNAFSFNDSVFAEEEMIDDIESMDSAVTSLESGTEIALPFEENLDLDAKILVWYTLDENEGWTKLGTVSGYPFSNSLNNGYLEFAAPLLQSWEDIANLKVKVEGVVGGETNFTVYLDSLWVEANYQEDIDEPEIISEKENWRADETPVFEIKKGERRSFKGLLQSDEVRIKTKLVRNKDIKVELDEERDVIFDRHNPRKITLNRLDGFKPGLYEINLDYEENGRKYTLKKSFTWGVLALNVNKVTYLPGEVSYIQMAVLQDDGHTVCDANLKLTVKNKESFASQEFLTEDGTLHYSGVCGPDNIIDVPDYYAYYVTDGLGVYEMTLVNLDNGYAISDTFEVKNTLEFDVERIGPTRIYPPADYRMELRVTPRGDFYGTVTETIPSGFLVKDSDSSEKPYNVSDPTREIFWNVDWKAGETYTLNYTFNAPDISPYLYLVGPLEIKGSGRTIEIIEKVKKKISDLFEEEVLPKEEKITTVDFEEGRQWQIASDAEVTIDSSLVDATDEYNPSPSGVFTGTNTGYVFYVDGTPYISYRKTTNGGTSWGSAITIAENKTFQNVAVWYDRWTPGDLSGDIIHIAAVENGTDDFWYNCLNISSDSLCSSSWTLIDAGSDTVPPDGGPSITKSTDGYLFAVWFDNTPRGRVAKSVNSGANWADITPASGMDDDDDHAQLLPLSGGDILLILWDESATDLLYNVYDEGADTWGGFSAIDSSLVTDTTYDAVFGATINKSSGNIYLAYNNDVDSATGDLKAQKFTESSRTWSALTDISSNLAAAIDVKVAIDSSNNDLYGIYIVGGTAGSLTDVYYKKSSNDGSSWGDAVKVNTTQDDLRTVRTDLFSSLNLYSFWYNDDLNDILGNTIVSHVENSPIIGAYGDSSEPVGIGETFNFYTTWEDSDSGTSWTQATATAQWTGGNYAGYAVFQDKLWVSGGDASINGSSLKNEVWYSSNGITWTQATANAQWSSRYQHQMLFFNNELWVIGGSTTNDVWHSLDGISWTQATSNAQWSGRSGHSSLVYGSKMWVIGGTTGSYVNDAWYSADGISWTQATANAQWSARAYSGRLVFNSRMWVIGGLNGSYSNDTWYSVTGATWTRATANAQWVARHSQASLVYGNNAWVLGGTTSGGADNDLWYSSNGTTWTQLTADANWSSRYASEAYVFQGKMWVMGGNTGAAVPVDVWYSSGETAKIHACKTNTAITDAGEDGGSCPGGSWFDSDSLSSTNYLTGTYTAATSDLGVREYYPFACSNGGDVTTSCSTNTATGAFWVDATFRNDGTGQSTNANWPASYDHGYAVFDDKMWILGGTYGGSSANQSNDVWYSTDGRIWTQATSNAQWIGRKANVLVHDNKMWLIAGRSRLNADLNDVWYSSDGVSWTQTIANAPWAARSYIGRYSFNSKLWIAGGGTSSGLNDVWYSSDGVVWTQLTTNAQFPGRYDHSSLVYQNQMLLTNGYSGSAYLNDVWYSTDGVSWTQKIANALFAGRSGSVMTIYEGRALMLAGYSGQYRNDIWYSLDGTTWTSITSSAAFPGRYRHGGFVYKNQLWVTGGIESNSTYNNDVWRSPNAQTFYVNSSPVNTAVSETPDRVARGSDVTFSLTWDDANIYAVPAKSNSSFDANFSQEETVPFGASWTRVTASMGTGGVSNFGYTVYDNKMWIISGSYSGSQNCVWYSSDGAIWTRSTLNAQFVPRFASTALTYDNKMWMMGGAYAALMNEVWYSTDGVSWTESTVNAQWAGRGYQSTIVYDNKMWLIAGVADDGGGGDLYLNDVWYSVNGVSWTRATSNAQFSARISAGSLVFNDRMWIFGGDPGSTYFNDVWYSVNGVSWTRATSNAQWSAKAYLSYAVYDDKMWILGGKTDGSTSTNDSWYSVDGVSWTRASTNNEWAARGYFASFDFNNKLWVVGGTNSVTKPDDSWTADLGTIKTKSHFCKTNAITSASAGGACDTGQTFYSTSSFSYSATQGGSYTTLEGDAGTRAYWAFSCDNSGASNACSTTDLGKVWMRATANSQWFNRRESASLVYDNKMWIYGGSNATTERQNDVWYSVDGTSWTQATANAQWTIRHRHGYAVFDDKMWVVGGYTSTYVNDVWHSVDGVSWTQSVATAPWSARMRHGTLVYDNKIWISGGYNGDNLNDVWYSSDGAVWTRAVVNAQWSKRDSHSFLVFNNLMWLIGGSTTNDVWYSSDGTTWTRAVANAPWAARAGQAGYVYGNKLWVVGGYGSSYYNDVWYSSDGTTWTRMTSNADFEARYMQGEVVYNNRLWIFGGWNGDDSLNDVWASSSGGTFFVNEAPSVSSVTDDPDPVVAGEDVTFSVTWDDDNLWRVPELGDGISEEYPSQEGTTANLGSTWKRATANAPWAGRQADGGVVFDDKLWLFAGYTGSRPNDVWYSSDGAVWTQAVANAQWDGRNAHAAVADGTGMWVMGGYSTAGANVNDVWYSVDGTTWTEITANAYWAARQRAAVTYFDNKLWLVGGAGFTNDVWYSSDGAVWTRATQYALWSRRYTRMTAFDNKLWIAGGYDGWTASGMNDVWYSSDGIVWTQTTANAQWGIRYFHEFSPYNNKLWVIAGYDGATNYNDAWYSADGVTWTQAIANIGFAAKNRLQVNVFRNRIWVYGGVDASVRYNDVWVNEIEEMNVKTHVCKTNVIENATTGGSCESGQTWVSSSIFDSLNPRITSYTTSGGDSGTKTYYAFVCDDSGLSNACSASSSGTFSFATNGVTVSGYAYGDEGGSVWSGCDSSTQRISAVPNGGSAVTGSCDSGTGYFEISGVATVTNEPVSVFFNTAGSNTDKGVAVTVAVDDSSNISINVVKNKVWLRTETGVASINNSDLDHCDSASPGDCANVPYSVSSSNLTTESGMELHIQASKTYDPGGTVTTDATGGDLHVDDNATCYIDTAVSAIGGDLLVDAGATLTVQSGPVPTTFLTIGGGDITTSGAGATVNYVDFPGVTISGTGNIGGGTSPTIQFYNLTISGTQTIASAITIGNDLVVDGTMQGSANVTTTVNGTIAGTGTVNMTGGKVEQRVNANENFSNTSGTNDWVFYDLQFSNYSTSSDYTVTTTGNSDCELTVTNILTVGLETDSYKTTLSAGSKIWTLSGSGTPFVLHATKGGFTESSSTVNYTGTSATNITAETYYKLGAGTTVDADAVTYTLLEDTTVTSVLTVGNAGSSAIDNFSPSSYTLTLSGSGTPFVITAYGNLSEGTSTVSYTGSSTTNVATETYYNLSLGTSNSANVNYVAGGSNICTNSLLMQSAASGYTNIFALSGNNLTVGSSSVANSGTISVPVRSSISQTGGTTTVKSSSGGAATVGGAGSIAFYNLSFKPDVASAPTFTLGDAGSQTIGVSYTLTIGDGTNPVVVNADTNDPTLNISRNVSIAANGTLTASASSDFNVAGSWTNSTSGTFNHSNGTVTFNSTSAGRSVTDGGDPFYDIVFETADAGTWFYSDGASTAPHSTTVNSGTATYLNAKTGSVTVNGGTLNVDWYLGAHLVDALDTGVDINTGDADITISENSGSPANTVFRYVSPTGWGSGSSSQTTGTGSDGINPQPINTGAIRVREYSQTSGGSTYYLYNLKVSWQETYGEYDYYADYGGKYLTSTLNTSSGNDEVISDAWYRSSISSINSPYSCAEGSGDQCLNNAPTNGSWYVGMMDGLTFSIDDSTIEFGTIVPGASPSDSTNTLTVTTSATNGYVITAWSSQEMTCSVVGLCGTETIGDWLDGNDAPGAWEAGSYGFGYSTDDITLTGGTADRFSGPKFAGFTRTGLPVADRSNTECPCSNQENIITYRVAAAGAQKAGPYQTTVIYVATANY